MWLARQAQLQAGVHVLCSSAGGVCPFIVTAPVKASSAIFVPDLQESDR
jgi:hypothetical protein